MTQTSRALAASQRSILHGEETFPGPSAFKPEIFLKSGGSLETEGRAEIVMNAFGFSRPICPGLHVAENNVFPAVVTVLYLFISSTLPRPFRCLVSRSRGDRQRNHSRGRLGWIHLLSQPSEALQMSARSAELEAFLRGVLDK